MPDCIDAEGGRELLIIDRPFRRAELCWAYHEVSAKGRESLLGKRDAHQFSFDGGKSFKHDLKLEDWTTVDDMVVRSQPHKLEAGG